MRKLRVHLWCAAFLAVQPALSAQLAMSQRASEIKTLISGVTFPSRLSQDLKSGLTTNILIHLELLHDSNTEAQADVRIAVRYDLWDEIFTVTETAANATTEKEEFPSVEKVMAFLSDIPIPNVFGLGTRPANERYQLQAQVLLNPIDKERLDSLKQWVAENAGTAGSVDAAAPGAVGPGVAAPSGAPEPNSLFNRIFRSYSRVGVSATWLQTVVSKPFTVKGMSDDGE